MFIVGWRIHMVVIFTYCGLAWSFVQVAWQYHAITWTNLDYLQSNMIFYKHIQNICPWYEFGSYKLKKCSHVTNEFMIQL